MARQTQPELRHNRRVVYASGPVARSMLEVVVHAGDQGLAGTPHGHVVLDVDKC